MRTVTLLLLLAVLTGCGDMAPIHSTEVEAKTSTTPSDTVIQIHAVADLLKRMPPIQVVGPNGTTDTAPIDGVIHLVHDHFAILERPTPKIVANGQTLVVVASNADHDEVGAALDHARSTLDTEGH